MDQAAHNKIVSFITGIAVGVFQDLFELGNYPDASVDSSGLVANEPLAEGVATDDELIEEAV